MRPSTAAAALGLVLMSSLAGCATVTTGTTQPINIDSDPQAAECTVTREGLVLGKVTTPAPLVIKRHASTIQVACRKDGYEDGRIVVNSRYETASAGNFLIGGVIGVMVDASSGASSRYESNVLVRLAPLSSADQAAVAARQPPVAVPAPVVTAAAPPSAPMLAGRWTTSGVLMLDRSAGSCVRSSAAYTFDLTGDTLTADSVNGRLFMMTVPADGAIQQSFRSPNGPFNSPTYEIVGNARTRDLELVNTFAGCRWKLTPDA
jgi:hypothetical protein